MLDQVSSGHDRLGQVSWCYVRLWPVSAGYVKL